MQAWQVIRSGQVLLARSAELTDGHNFKQKKNGQKLR